MQEQEAAGILQDLTNVVRNYTGIGKQNQENQQNQQPVQEETQETQQEEAPKVEQGTDLDRLGDALANAPNLDTIEHQNFQEQIDTEPDKCEDKTCCPPAHSHFNTSNQYRQYLLKKEMSWTMRVLSLFVIIAIGIVGTASYMLYKLIKTIINYVKNLNFVQGFKNSVQFENYSNNKYTNRLKNNNQEKQAENTNDYYKYQQGINKTIENFTNHNNKLRKIFNKPNPPGLINENILNKQFDNW